MRLSSSAFVLIALLALSAQASPIGSTNAVANGGFDLIYGATSSTTSSTPVTLTDNSTYSEGFTEAPIGAGSTTPSYSYVTLPDFTGTLGVNSSYGLLQKSSANGDATPVIFMNYSVGSQAVYQDLGNSGSLLLPDTSYLLSVTVIHRSDTASLATPSVGLSTGADWPDATLWTPSSQGINTDPGLGKSAVYTYTFTTGSTLPTGDLFVYLGAGGTAGQVNYDNLSLVAETPEPAIAALLLLPLGGLLLGRRRRLE